METKSIDDLKQDPKNPRRISTSDFEALKKSIAEFGDLSGIVLNVRTQQLVGGHQRVQAFKALPGSKQIVITDRLDVPNKQGTIAQGYISHDNEMYTYREVDWDENRQAAANIAANRIEGEWDLDLLAEANAMLEANAPDLLALTGQTDEEKQNLASAYGPSDDTNRPDDGLRPLSVRLTDDQLSTVYDAIGKIKLQKTLTNEPNKDLDGNALYYICQSFLSAESQANATPESPVT